MSKKEYVGTCYSGDKFYMSGNDCASACDCKDWGMNCMSPNLDCVDSYAVRDFCSSRKSEFQCSCPRTAERDVDGEDLSPSAPLRPTFAAYFAVTKPYSSPQLRPTSVVFSTVSPIDLSPRADNVASSSAAGHVVECSASDMQANTFSEVCKNGLLVPISGESCQKWCHCDDDGHMSCDSPASGCPESYRAVTIFCSSDKYDFGCQCVHNATRRAELAARDASSMTCSGADMTTRIDSGVVCMDGTTLHWSGETCAQYCECDGDSIHCKLPSDCGPVKDINAFCAIGPNFTCQCPQRAKRQEIDAPGHVAGNVRDLGERDDGSQSLSYHTRDEIEAMGKRGEAIVHRNLDALPSNTREMIKRDTAEFTPSTETSIEALVEKVEPLPAAALIARSDFELKCAGPDMLKTINIGDAGHCPTDIQIYLNGYYCQAHCGCDHDGCVTCAAGGAPTGIDECGGDDAATAFCAADRTQFACGCYNKHGARLGCQY